VDFCGVFVGDSGFEGAFTSNCFSFSLSFLLCSAFVFSTLLSIRGLLVESTFVEAIRTRGMSWKIGQLCLAFWFSDLGCR
jgi:hypothetical protein